MSPTPITKLLMSVVITLGLLGSGLYVLLTFNWADNPQMVAAATGWIGICVGYWMR